MSVWAIADLHLSLARPDRRERFAARWRDHADKIEAAWRESVKPGDLVLLPGDLSMARNHRDLQPDLAWLDRLPGTKVLAPGNHDAWFNGVERVRPLMRRSLRIVGGDAVAVDDAVVCGTLGAPIPADTTSDDERAAGDRELDNLGRALDRASGLRKPGRALHVLWHYPPFDPHGRPGPCVPLLEAAGATTCVYGHLHIEGQWSQAAQGLIRGVRYHCVAADAVGFRPLRVDKPIPTRY